MLSLSHSLTLSLSLSPSLHLHILPIGIKNVIINHACKLIMYHNTASDCINVHSAEKGRINLALDGAKGASHQAVELLCITHPLGVI